MPASPAMGGAVSAMPTVACVMSTGSSRGHGSESVRTVRKRSSVAFFQRSRATFESEAVEEFAEQHRLAALVQLEHRAAVEVPPEDEDRALGVLGGARERGKIRLGVDEQRHALGARHFGAVDSWPEDALVRHGEGPAGLRPS